MKIDGEIRSVFEHKHESQKNSKCNLNFIHLLSEPGDKLGTFPKDPSKQRGNFGRLNQSQNKLRFLFRTDIAKGSKKWFREIHLDLEPGHAILIKICRTRKLICININLYETTKDIQKGHLTNDALLPPLVSIPVVNEVEKNSKFKLTLCNC